MSWHVSSRNAKRGQAQSAGFGCLIDEAFTLLIAPGSRSWDDDLFMDDVAEMTPAVALKMTRLVSSFFAITGGLQMFGLHGNLPHPPPFSLMFQGRRPYATEMTKLSSCSCLKL